jgi:DNA anti-recombination protein RmuC
VEENALVILKNLSMLTTDISRLKEDFDLLGGHLVNAGRKYDDTHKRLEKFVEKISNIQDAGGGV